MLPTLQIGPVALPVPALLILAGLWAALTLSERAASKAGLSQIVFYQLVLISLGAGVAAARLSYVIQYPSAFASSPLSLISLNPGLFDLSAGAAAAILASMVYTSRKAIPFWTTLDILTPGLAVLSLALGLSHIASGAAFGEPSRLPWAIQLWGEKRQPTQFYETLLAGLILGIVLFLQNKPVLGIPGSLFLAFLALSAASRIFLEAFRGDSTLLAGGVRNAQVMAWAVLAMSLWLLGRKIYSPSAVGSPPGGES